MRRADSIVRVLSYLILALGIANALQYAVVTHWRFLPLDMGIALGNGAIVLIGAVALALANGLARLERRLDSIEGAGRPSEGSDREKAARSGGRQ